MAAPISLTAATTLEQQAYLCGLALLNGENALPADTRPNNAQIAYDTEAATVDISIKLDTLMTIASNTAVIAVKPYLA